MVKKYKTKKETPTKSKGEEYNQNTKRLMEGLMKSKEWNKFEKHYLSPIFIMDSTKSLICIHLFKCPSCGRIITAQQLNYARCCGLCDTNNKTIPPYKIETVKERWVRYEKEKERLHNAKKKKS